MTLRNDPCPCGSGKRYKHCCGMVATAAPAGDAPPPSPGGQSGPSLLPEAMRLHQAGLLDQAEALYQRVIAADPREAIGHHYLGVLAMQRGDLATAEAKLREALVLRADIPDFFGNLGLVLRLGKRHEEATQAYRQALALDPHHAVSHNNLGLSLHALGDLDAAVEHFNRALAIQPQFAEALVNLGASLQAGGQLEAAAAAYRKALTLRPDDVETHVALGRLLNERLKQFGPAEQAFRRAAELRPGDASIQHHLGAVLREDRTRLNEAEAAYRRALAIEPNAAYLLNDLGSLLFEMKRFEAAEAMLRQAIMIAPDFPVALESLGNMLKDLRRQDEAEACYRTALRLSPESASARWNLSLLLLSQGRLAEGWPLHEARYDPTHWQRIVRIPRLPFPQWQGEALEGKSVMVLPEQGFGDNIQFVRYLAVLKQKGAHRVTLFCKSPLLGLFQGVSGADAVIDATAPPKHDEFDLWTLLLSIPLQVGTTLDNIPADLPYLAASPEAIAHWRHRLPTGGFRIGLVWKGNAAHTNDADRSLPGLASLAPLWSVSGASFVSLQKGAGEVEAARAIIGQPLLHLGGEIRDFADTAAIISQLDLVITVDTAIAHLAGALGKPVWVLLPYIGTDWRWLLDRDDSPWYPRVMRLFRQAEPGNWDAVIEHLTGALGGLLDRHRG
jgi:tetratricopeptide (TPR) repeat protein